MKIYVVTHFYDNGESYEDYREYTDYFMFSTEAKAYNFYCEKILSDYEGKYSIIEWALDTQEKVLLEESPWIECSSLNSYEDWQGDYEPEYDQLEPCYDQYGYYFNPRDPEKRSHDALWALEMLEREEYYEELSLENEWLTHEGTNYQEWEEVNEEIRKRKNDILFEELNEILKELC